MQEFFIKKNSLNPLLRVEALIDGRYQYKLSMINNALQNSDVTFSMRDEETGILKISNSPAEIVLSNEKNCSCEEKYVLQYKWNKRDVAKEGFFIGWFEIKFKGDLTDGDKTIYPQGNLIIPIQEELRIIIK